MRNKLFLLLAAMLMSIGAKAQKEVYTSFVESTGTLTYYCDDQRATRTAAGETTEIYDPVNNPNRLRFNGYNTKVHIAKIDISMADTLLTSTRRMFYGGGTASATAAHNYSLTDLKAIQGMENLNTANVTDMSGMFEDCRSLTSIDLSHLSTANVTDMSDMFGNCRELAYLDLSTFSTANIQNTNYMFFNCSKLILLDMSSFGSLNAQNMIQMFTACSNLSTIICESEWNTSNPNAAKSMFEGCVFLIGKQGTACDGENNIGIEYARLDGLDGKPGYFSSLLSIPNRVYTEYNADTQTLTYYCDDHYLWREGIEMYHSSRLSSHHNDIQTIKFDATMRDTLLYSAMGLFCVKNNSNNGDYSMPNLTEIQGLENLKTDKMTDMSHMFSGCSSLTSLDLSSFNTDNVTDFGEMFYGCSSLESLDLSHFSTTKVTKMDSMFYGCSSLTSLDLSHFDTRNVTDMEYMFRDCSNLITIFCGGEWNASNSNAAASIFRGCTSLVGEQGTACDGENNIGIEYARLDGLNGQPGYFSKKKNEVYSSYNADTQTLTFYCDALRLIRTGINELYEPRGTRFKDCYASVQKVKIDVSMKDTMLTSMRNLFFGGTGYDEATSQYVKYALSNMTEIEGLENLVTDEVTNMSNMFADCSALTSLDLSSFNTAKVADMSSMFSGCTSLESLNIQNFNTANVSTMQWMFYDCYDLESLDLSRFNTRNVANMSSMFEHCSALTSLDLRSFNIEKLTEAQYMFRDCGALTTILGDDNWSKSTKLELSDGMFERCFSLVGGNGTAYSAGNPGDKTYARSDGVCDRKGYFTTTKTKPVFGLQDNEGTLGSVIVGNTYNAAPALYNHQNLPYTWSTSDLAALAVDENGVLTPHEDGVVSLIVHTDGNDQYTEAIGTLNVSISYPLYLFATESPVGIKVTPYNADDIMGDGKLSYDYATHTLTMNNWTYDFTERYALDPYNEYIGTQIIYNVDNEPLTVNLIGTNTLQNCGELFYLFGDLIFTGSGSLTVNSDKMAVSASNQLVIDGPSLDLRMATNELDPYQRYTNNGVFWADRLSVVNGGHLHAVVTTDVDLMQCGSCYTVGRVNSALEGDILTEHVIWSNDPANESVIYSNYQLNAEDYIGCFFNDEGYALLPREIEIAAGEAPPVHNKNDVDLYFERWDWETQQDVRVTSMSFTRDEFGYVEGNFDCPQLKWSLEGKPVVAWNENDPDDVVYVDIADDQGENENFVCFNVTGNYGTARVTAYYPGDEEYNPAEVTVTVTVENGKLWFNREDLVFKTESNPGSGVYDVLVESLIVTEGDTVVLPKLCHRNGTRPESHLYKNVSSMSGHFDFPCADEQCTHTLSDRIVALVAGEDQLIESYRFYSDEPEATAYLPITVKPYLTPVISDETTVFDFSDFDPSGSEWLLFSLAAEDNYNAEDGCIDLTTPNSEQDIDDKAEQVLEGSASVLQMPSGTITFELEPGEGTIEIDCQTKPGYKLRVCIAENGHAFITSIIEQEMRGKATVSYSVSQKTYVIIYLELDGSSPAPARIARATQDAGAGARIYSIRVMPNAPEPPFAITAHQDPENAGDYYATFYHGTKSYALPDNGTEAYVATIDANGDLNMTKVAENADVLPADVAVILKAPAVSISLTSSEESPVTITAPNQLVGTDVDMPAPDNCYVLSGRSSDNTVVGVGFYMFNGTLAAHKAYVIYSGAASPQHRMHFIFDNEQGGQGTTGIDQTTNDQSPITNKVIMDGRLYIIRGNRKYNAQGQVVK